MIYLYTLLGMSSSFVVVATMVFLYTRYKKNMMQQQISLKAAELNHQRALTQIVIESQELERKEIGKELHDDVGNAIASLRLFINRTNGHEQDQPFVDEATKRVDAILQKVRALSHQLSVAELELFGLREAIYMLAENIAYADVLHINIEEDQVKIPETYTYSTSVAIYRIIQELLTNTIKHANATYVSLIFMPQTTEGIMFHYLDDGVGLQSSKMLHGIGFKNIETRLQTIGGSFELDHANTSGFAAYIFLPKPPPVVPLQG